MRQNQIVSIPPSSIRHRRESWFAAPTNACTTPNALARTVTQPEDGALASTPHHRKLIELGERSPELYYNAALICQKRGQLEDAVSYYQQALQEHPQFAEALLNLGHAMMALGQEEEARTCWRRAIREKPEQAHDYFEPPTG